MSKELCRDCFGWENEICVNKFSPFFKKPVAENHRCQQIQTDKTNTGIHPKVIRDGVWDTGMRYRD